MAPVKPGQPQQSWSEINKVRKEEKRKWKELNLAKKIEKQKIKDEVAKLKDETQKTPTKSTPTISIAVPGSILETAQSPELRSYLAGQIARAACIFQVDEIVVFDDYADQITAKKATLEDNYGVKTLRASCVQLGRILQYLECPQYLRKNFFPIHSNLQYCGILNPLNSPHHLSKDEDFQFREGVVTNKPVKPGKGSIVHVGLHKEVHIDKLLTAGLRCTVKILPDQKSSKKLRGVVVAPSTPRTELGLYWGYTIRLANSLSKVFSQCPFKDGYDVTIGTSDKGTSIDEFSCDSFKHVIIVFGGVQGLEAALESDTAFNVEDPELIFDHYLNTLPQQGSKTIRTEEAVLVTLSALRSKLRLSNSSGESSSGSM